MEETNLSQENSNMRTPMIQAERNPYLDVEGSESTPVVQPSPNNMQPNPNMMQPTPNMMQPNAYNMQPNAYNMPAQNSQSNPYLEVDAEETVAAQGIAPMAVPLPGEPEDMGIDAGQQRSRISMYNKAKESVPTGMKMHESSDLSPDVE